jgi:hypothetical protein
MRAAAALSRTPRKDQEEISHEAFVALIFLIISISAMPNNFILQLESFLLDPNLVFEKGPLRPASAGWIPGPRALDPAPTNQSPLILLGVLVFCLALLPLRSASQRVNNEKYKTKPNNSMNPRTFHFDFDENNPNSSAESHLGAVFHDLGTIRIFHLT